MNTKRITLAATTFTLAGLLLSACSGTTSGSLAPTSSPETQTQSEVPQTNETTPAITPTAQQPAPASPSPVVTAEEAGPKMSSKDDADSLDKDLNNTNIQTENFN